MRTVEDDFAMVGEIDCDTARDIGLHLPNAPVGLIGMAYEHTRSQDGVQIVQDTCSCLCREGDLE